MTSERVEDEMTAMSGSKDFEVFRDEERADEMLGIGAVGIADLVRLGIVADDPVSGRLRRGFAEDVRSGS